MIFLLPIFLIAYTTFLYAYFFAIRGTNDEIFLASTGFLIGLCSLFWGYAYFDIWGVFLSSIVMIIGFTNICQMPQILKKIKNIRSTNKLLKA